MTFLFKNKIQSACALLVAALSFASCTREEEVGAAVGYLHFPAFRVDLTVEDLVETRAVDLAGVPSDASEVTFVVKDKDGTEVYNKQGAWTQPLILPVGAYTIEATYGENTFAAPYFKGSAQGTIAALGQEKPSLQMSLQNAMVRVSVSDGLAEHFTPGTTVVLSITGQTATAAYDTWYYVPAGSDISVKLKGTNEAGNEAEFSYTLSSPAAGTAYNVVCDKDATNWPTLTLPEQQDGAWNTRLYIAPATIGGNMSEANKEAIVYEVSASNSDWSNPIIAEQIEGDYYVAKGLTNGSSYYVRARIGKITSEAKAFTVNENLSGVNVSAAHYNDGSGHLAGTNATVSLGLTGILKTLNDAGLLQVSSTLSNASATVRTATADGVMTAANGWPYLPQGSNYVLTVNHKLSSESETLSSGKSGFSVAAPTFTVSMGASYSSYDKYLASDITAANNCNAETIYGVGASWGIAAALMSNSNYTKSVKIYLGDTEKASQTPTTNSFTLGNITGLTTWQAYTLKASVTFDGKTVEATKNHHITGLPYNAAPPKNSGNHPWTSNASETITKIIFNGDNVEMSTSATPAPYITSPAFHIPANINVTVSSSAKVDAYKFAIWYTQNYIASIGGAQVFKQASGKQTGAVYNPSGTGTFTSANNTLKCASDYIASGPKIVIYSVTVSYR